MKVIAKNLIAFHKEIASRDPRRKTPDVKVKRKLHKRTKSDSPQRQLDSFRTEEHDRVLELEN
jgi:hypothetical protein